jgi:hypothetical protein
MQGRERGVIRQSAFHALFKLLTKFLWRLIELFVQTMQLSFLIWVKGGGGGGGGVFPSK